MVLFLDRFRKKPTTVDTQISTMLSDKQIKDQKRVEIIALSEQLSNILGKHAINAMKDTDRPIIVAGYALYVNSRPWNSWKDQIEVLPADTGSDYGYSNTGSPVFKESGWYYVMQGTATEILPPKEVIDKIKEELKHV